MDVLVTGAAGRVGTAVLDHLHDRAAYSFTGLDVEDHPEYDVRVADITDYTEIRPAFEGKDAVVHLARPKGNLSPFSTRVAWNGTLTANLVGNTNVVQAAVNAGVETVVFSSSHHVVGMYELDNAPEIYESDFGLELDHTTPIRPDSMYAVMKAYTEAAGRLAADAHDLSFYALRLGNLRWDDHPYVDAEEGVVAGDFDRGSDEYEAAVNRLKASFLSRADAGRLVDACLQDQEVDFDVFYGVSDNARRWFDIDHARERLGYDPQDDGDDWDAPP